VTATGLTLIGCATIVDRNKVLFVRHAAAEKPDYGQWLLPAGGVEPRITLEEALKREISEEPGLRIKVIKKLVEHADPCTKDRSANFLCNPLTSKVETSSKLSEAEWFSA
jgi:ADP-ribose pyrophosphatase YjhB (NUDIX family)